MGSEVRSMTRQAAPERSSARPSVEKGESPETIAGPEERAGVADSLIARAGQSLAAGDDVSVAAALGRAEAMLPARRARGSAWAIRAANLYRIKAALSQKQGAHLEAVAAFRQALAEIPSDPRKAGRNGNAARLQLLLHLARSRLALGQARETVSEMRSAQSMLAALEGTLPPRAIETLQVAALAHSAPALAVLGKLDAAERDFAAGIAAIDQLGGSDLAGLRAHMLDGWAAALRKAGRNADADAMLAAFGTPASHSHHGSCGCGHYHSHDHGNRPGGQDHHHHDGCGCSTHSD